MSIKNKDVADNYILITNKNKDILLLHGRILYVIVQKGATDSEIRGWFELRPRLKKGWLSMEHAKIIDSQSFFIKEDEHIDDYKDFGRYLLKYIEQGRLYTKVGEPLTKYSNKK